MGRQSAAEMNDNGKPEETPGRKAMGPKAERPWQPGRQAFHFSKKGRAK
jgi:hypothetical protein